jgi:2-polyprenyl-6-methoxyphenol hydroxylase-like FAD-dependent oxidoreductase
MANDTTRGLIGVGGFIKQPIPEPILEDKALVFTFGPNGFFGYGAGGPDTVMWWSTCEAKAPPAQLKISVDEMKAQLQTRHGKWKDPIIHDIIAKCDVDHIYPVWTTPVLPKWGEKGLVLVGDAAHALQPTSGQGSSQALEDSKCLSLLLSRLLEAGNGVDDAIDLSTKALYEIRNPRIQRIADRTKTMSSNKADIGVAAEMMMCFFLWLMGKVPAVGKALLGDVNKELYYWDMEGLVEQAVAKSSDQNLAENMSNA